MNMFLRLNPANSAAGFSLLPNSLKKGVRIVKIQESGENYLETVLILEKKNGTVRSVDVANYLCVSKPSVSRAMSVLKKAGLISQESYGDIYLTEAGRQKAEAVLHRHRLISKFLRLSVGIDVETAERDACRIEHVVSKETEDGMRRYVAELEKEKA